MHVYERSVSMYKWYSDQRERKTKDLTKRERVKQQAEKKSQKEQEYDHNLILFACLVADKYFNKYTYLTEDSFKPLCFEDSNFAKSIKCIQMWSSNGEHSVFIAT
jgi:hypothetical protein